ncbi:MAG: efflux RND transporter permease subunit [Nitrospirae bacterium]|nr:efflux RND transporter permease subunit [Nitrospirota bacterium]
MIEKLIEACAKNRFMTLLVILSIALFGVWSVKHIPLDAIPDLSDTQVIVYSRWDRSPDIMEDQVTYPIISAMLGAPKVKAIRGFSDFGYSYVYMIFEDGTDIYWARSRTLEYLSKVTPLLPEGVRTELGPDATGVGWVFQYALVDTSGKQSLADLRSFQDWTLRYYLQGVPGVAEVAPIGGFVRQYQVNLDPNALLSYKIPIEKVMEAIRNGNNDVGGRLLEFSGREYMVRGRGYARSTADIEKIVVGVSPQSGTPILVKNLGSVVLGPDIRRGLADLNGEGDVVGGIVIMRHGENALKVIDRVKKKLKDIEPTLPEGVKLVTTYDRSDLILRSIETLKDTLVEEMVVVSLVILVFLWHIPSAIIPIFTLPIAVLFAFIPMYFMGLSSNIMSLGGIAVAIGALVDAAVVVVENAHKKLERWMREGRQGDYRTVLIGAIQEVGRPSFYSLMVIAVAFIPVFTLEAQEGRLFRPLAFTKNFSMFFAAILAITLDPAIRLLFMRFEPFIFRPKWLAKVVNAAVVGELHEEDKHPISRVLFRFYQPAAELMLRRPKTVVLVAVAIVIATVPFYFKLGSEFMPPLYEGTLLYMPTTPPGISVTESGNLLNIQDRIIKSFPEVDSVFGKAGRAETSTDPAPFSMMETTVVLKPEAEWRKVDRWYSWMPEVFKKPLRHAWREAITPAQLVDEMDQALKIPGSVNAWTMPIKARIDMLTTGVRTPVGIKIFGADLKEIERIGEHIEMVLKPVKGTRSIFAERTAGGYFVDFDLKREELARYGLSVADAEMVIMSAIGGENVSQTVEGRERYPINVRYARELRNDMERLKRVLVPTESGAQVPISQLADIRMVTGPSMIRDENGRLAGYVYVDVAGRDIGSYVADAKKAVREQVQMPAGYALTWSGQYESMERVKERLKLVLPITVFIIFFLLYMNTKSLTKTFIVFLAVPFSAVGAIWFLYALGYQSSIAVWVGLIALMGLDAETGIFMLLYLDLAYDEWKAKGKLKTKEDLREAILYGAVKRVRPKVMTVACAAIGLLPIMWSTGAGADVMKRIAAPMIGGLFTSFIMELLVYPVIYELWRGRELKKVMSRAT